MKVKPVIIISITLIIGFAIGFLASSMISHQRMKRFRSFNSVESFKRRTIHLIEPTEEQNKEILPLIDEYAKKMNQIRKDFGKEFFTLMKEFHNEIIPFLTEEQIERLELLQRPPSRDSRSQSDSTKRGHRSDGKPPGRGR
jgi:uncharacterized membrane protein (DUF106 family)